MFLPWSSSVLSSEFTIGRGMETLFNIFICGHLCRCVRNVSLYLIGILGCSCLSLAVDSIDVFDSLLEVEGISESSPDCELEYVEGVGLLLLLVLGVVPGKTDCDGVLGVEGILVESAAGGEMQGLLVVVM